MRIAVRFLPYGDFMLFKRGKIMYDRNSVNPQNHRR